MIRTIDTDVLVVGGGGASARAALEAHLAGAKVTLAVKGEFGAVGIRGSGATSYGISELGALLAAGVTTPPAEDKELPSMDPDEDFSDIIQLGLGLTNRRLAEILVQESQEARESLKKWGWVFHLWGMKSHGVPIVAALENQIKNSDIVVLDRTMVTDLLLQGDACVGAVTIDETTGEMMAVKAGAVILGTGGDANLYRFNMNPPCTTGDGYAMGYQAGAELMNMEFKQMLMGVAYPTKNIILSWFYQPHVKLINGHGEEFLEKYIPQDITSDQVFEAHSRHNIYSTRDDISKYFEIALLSEVKEGLGNEHDCLYLDMRDQRVDLGLPQRDNGGSTEV